MRASIVDGERLTAQSLIDEVRHNAPIIKAHTWTIRVEDTHDARVHIVIAVICHRKGLSKTLTFIIDPTRTDRIYITPVIFRLRMHQWITIDFRSGCQQETRLLGERQSKRVMSAQCTHFQSLNRVMQIIHRTGQRSQMKHHIQMSSDVDIVGNVMLNEMKTWMPCQVRDVLS
ncbi:MAG: hypothetical protein BWY63_02219 [Chloroflexi bacterium ADurb.Bin360]|nr:MAG: hypothetical protein BWY63_02219 [Chloroflexi bacterium ADurb.Bin360]